jgi:hypothetical protein
MQEFFWAHRSHSPLSDIVAAGGPFLFSPPAAGESSGIYKNPRRTLIRFSGTSWLSTFPTCRRARCAHTAANTCKFRCSPSGLQLYVFRLSWSIVPAPAFTNVRRHLPEPGFRPVLPSTRGSLKRHAANRTHGPEVQFHRNTTLPGREENVRRAPMKDHSLTGK